MRETCDVLCYSYGHNLGPFSPLFFLSFICISSGSGSHSTLTYVRRNTAIRPRDAVDSMCGVCTCVCVFVFADVQLFVGLNDCDVS